MSNSNFTKDNGQYKILKDVEHEQEKDLTETHADNQKINMQNNFSDDNTLFDDSLANRGRVAIFIDGSNLFHAALQLNIEIDYARLLCRLTQTSRLLRAFFYTGIDRANDKQQGFLLWMRRHGYRVVTKDLMLLPDGSKSAKLDVEIAVDLITLAPYYDTAILVSGDGDLAYAVNAVSYQGIRIEIVSLRTMASDSLIDVADCFIDLELIKHDIQKDAHSTDN